jgi:hypothetical protein
MEDRPKARVTKGRTMIEMIRLLHLQVAGSTRRRFITVRRQGVSFDLGEDGTLELFRVGVLAEAVDRTRDRVVEWEKNRLIPPPLFAVYGERWRYISAAQLTNVNRLAVARFAGRRYVPAYIMETFFDDVWATWYQPEIVVGTDGVVDRKRAMGVRRPPAAPPKLRARRVAW